MTQSNTLKGIVFINGKPIYTYNKALTILELGSFYGINIPRFCYHARLSIAGNCRMCLVEIYKSFKPVIACSTPISDGMEVYTDTALIKHSREHVLEFLLINHPLDCPICDQGGECDLQDQAIIYGSDRGRFRETKRSVQDKYMGPFIKTIMTRCIHCTRCIRFTSEIAGEPILGTHGRGKNTEIGMYIERAVTSIFSGNLIDICPVGALTSKPFAFSARSWELRPVDSIDILDTLGNFIRIDTRGSEIVRISPRYNRNLDEEWISDKIRFCYDGLKTQRLTVPLLRKSTISGQRSYISISWQQSFQLISQLILQTLISSSSLKGFKFALGDLIDVETTLLLKDITHSLGVEAIPLSPAAKISNNDLRGNYLFNTKVKYMDTINLYFIVATNVVWEAPILSLKISRNVSTIKRDFMKLIGYIGPNLGSNNFFAYKHMGLCNSILIAILEGRHYFSTYITLIKNNVFFSNSLFCDNFPILVHFINKITNCKMPVNIIQKNINSIAAKEFNVEASHMFFNKFIKKHRVDILYVVGNTNTSVHHLAHTYLIYQGHHGDENATNAFLLLPSSTFTEKSSLYLTNEGVCNHTRQATLSPGVAKSDFDILLALSLYCNFNTTFKKPNELLLYLTSRGLFNISFSHFSNNITAILTKQAKATMPLNQINRFASVKPSIYNFYSTDIISRKSRILQLALNRKREHNFYDLRY
uniref:NADH dehydrogenase subunit 11 n=1 Tax=Eukaryota sp. BB2 TaxID=1949062 RepID=A0A1X8VEZ5_9EUKA|nr:NADH dehydrogenase subunit 11 [Eukaryota sp. BB2]AQL10474.1 NADH dehydrogenase subunit 11 [Eukaryota sp. BB2]